MTKTQVAGFLTSVFDGVEGSRFFPSRYKPTVDEIKAKVISAESEIAAGLPETFDGKDVIHRFFTMAEGWWPKMTAELEVIKWAVDRFIATPPAA